MKTARSAGGTASAARRPAPRRDRALRARAAPNSVSTADSEEQREEDPAQRARTASGVRPPRLPLGRTAGMRAQ